MSKKYIMAIDEGTTSVRVSLYDIKKNKILTTLREPIESLFPVSGWVEQNAEETWQKTEGLLHKVLSKINPAEVFGIGITNQRETVVAWNKKTGKAICPAIVWQCRRTVDYCKKQLKGNIAQTIHRKTGLIPDAYFSATKIKWILENDTKAKTLQEQKSLCFGTMDSFLTFKLTGGKSFVTDLANASRTMLCNIKTGKWDSDLLALFNIQEETLPKIVDNDVVVGNYHYKGMGIPIAGLIGDQQSSLFGQLCINKGDLKNTYGTGSFMLLNIGDKPIYSKNRMVTTIAWRVKDKIAYALEGSVFNCGSSIEWLKDLSIIQTPAESDILAESVKSSNGVYFVPAFTGLGAPYWDGNARALFCGITRGTTKAQMVRAVLDGIAFGVKDIYDVIHKDTELTQNVIHVDGGVSKSEFTMQYQSDLLGKNIQCAKEAENTSLGAIYLCGLATGVWNSLNELVKLYKPAKVFKPKKSQQIMMEKYEGWKKAVSRALTK